MVIRQLTYIADVFLYQVLINLLQEPDMLYGACIDMAVGPDGA